MQVVSNFQSEANKTTVSKVGPSKERKNLCKCQPCRNSSTVEHGENCTLFFHKRNKRAFSGSKQ